VDISNMDAVFSMLDNWATIHGVTGRLPKRTGNQHPFTAPYDCFKATDGYVVIGVGNSLLFRTLMAAISKPELAQDRRFKSAPARLERHDEVNALIGDWVKDRTVDEVMEILGPAGANIPCAPVMTMDRLMTDPQIQAREMVVNLPHATLGQIPVSGIPFKLSASPGQLERLGPDLGEHNDDIYRGVLGLSDGEIQQLQADGVI